MTEVVQSPVDRKQTTVRTAMQGRGAGPRFVFDGVKYEVILVMDRAGRSMPTKQVDLPTVHLKTVGSMVFPELIEAEPLARRPNSEEIASALLGDAKGAQVLGLFFVLARVPD